MLSESKGWLELKSWRLAVSVQGGLGVGHEDQRCVFRLCSYLFIYKNASKFGKGGGRWLIIGYSYRSSQRLVDFNRYGNMKKRSMRNGDDMIYTEIRRRRKGDSRKKSCMRRTEDEYIRMT